jgi:ABC-type bacteriocin/lantibiotic exporter with double-glycine peptidase domain
MPAGVGKIRYYDESMEKPQITRKILARVLEYFIPYWKQMLVAVAAILISSVLGLAPSIFIKDIVDQALPHRDLKLLGLLIAVSVLIQCFQERILQTDQEGISTGSWNVMERDILVPELLLADHRRSPPGNI